MQYHNSIPRSQFVLVQYTHTCYLTMADSVVTLEYKGRVAVLTIRNEAKLNALNGAQYYEIAQKLREIATHDEVFVTVLLAKGRYFSAYACRPFKQITDYTYTPTHLP